MNKTCNSILHFMGAGAYRGVREFDFFDLRYELSMPTDVLLSALDQLAVMGKTERISDRVIHYSGEPVPPEEEASAKKDGGKLNAESVEETGEYSRKIAEFFERRRRLGSVPPTVRKSKSRRPQPHKKTVFDSYDLDEHMAEFIEDYGNDYQLEMETAYIIALRYAVREGEISMYDLMHEYDFSFATAQELVERMEEEGHISEHTDETRTHKVLLTPEEFKKRYGKL